MPSSRGTGQSSSVKPGMAGGQHRHALQNEATGGMFVTILKPFLY